MLMLRLQRIGRRNEPHYKIVVIEKTKGPKSQKYIDIVGSYNPKAGLVTINEDKAKKHLANGVQPSDTVYNMLVTKGLIEGKKKNVLPRKSPVIDEEKIAREKEEAEAKATAAKEALEAEAKATAEAKEALEAEAKATEEAAVEEPVTEDTASADVAPETVEEPAAEELEAAVEEPVTEDTASADVAPETVEEPAAEELEAAVEGAPEEMTKTEE
jgi:small subunit ribosomal protein S16